MKQLRMMFVFFQVSADTCLSTFSCAKENGTTFFRGPLPRKSQSQFWIKIQTQRKDRIWCFPSSQTLQTQLCPNLWNSLPKNATPTSDWTNSRLSNVLAHQSSLTSEMTSCFCKCSLEVTKFLSYNNKNINSEKIISCNSNSWLQKCV